MAVNTVAYGFENLQDVFPSLVSDVGVENIDAALDQSFAEHNRQVTTLLDLFSSPIDPLKPQSNSDAASVARSQPLDENGRARPIRPAGVYQVAFPILASGNAWGKTFTAGAKMTVRQVNRLTLLMQEGDLLWVRDHVLAALMASAAWVFPDDELGPITIQPLALASDGVKYFIRSGAGVAAVDTHLLGQAAAISNAANPFPAMAKELLEHPENSGQVIALVPTNLLGSIQLLDDYIMVRDPNVQVASTVSSLTGDLGVEVPGIIRGYVDGVWIVEWLSMPDNYIVFTTTNGDRALGQREDPEVVLQGFKEVADRDNHPWYEKQYQRRTGFGARNRVGAVVLLIGNAVYSTPAGYESPMP